MILRLKSRLVSGLIVSAVGVTGAMLANAADTNTGAAAGPTGAAAAATTSPSTPAATPSGGTANAASPNAAGTAASESTMAPRGANPSTSTAATSGSTGAAETTKDSPARRLFDQLDLNHDGSLSFEEFSRATFQQPAGK